MNLGQKAIALINTILMGKSQAIEDAVCTLLANGHLLVEDIPGVGKTTLTLALSKVFGLQFTRVQFTSDLLPTDLSGLSVFDRNRGEFVFRQGPLFTQVLLADEINRASPKTQSALLESMEERQISIEGKTYKLEQPFFVMATQNPTEQVGTFALPESQLDRFLMCIFLGYPDPAAERLLLTGKDRRSLIASLQPVCQIQELLQTQAQVQEVKVSSALLDYFQRLLATTRNGKWFAEGLSPRAALGFLRAAKARAYIENRDYVIPDDVQRIAASVIAHRLRGLTHQHWSTLAKRQSVSKMLAEIEV